MKRVRQAAVIALILGPAHVWAGGDPQNIAINEVFYGGGAGEDWVELINRGSEPVDISESGAKSGFTLYPGKPRVKYVEPGRTNVRL